MHVIAKMEVASIEDYGFSRKLKLRTVYDGGINTGDNAENRSFTKATPNGEAWMTVDNKAVWPEFHVAGGSEQEGWVKPSVKYVVFIDAEKYSLADVHRALAYLEAED